MHHRSPHMQNSTIRACNTTTGSPMASVLHGDFGASCKAKYCISKEALTVLEIADHADKSEGSYIIVAIYAPTLWRDGNTYLLTTTHFLIIIVIQ
jgi:hypothetical protein